ncbi:MAG: molybdopterin-binding protein [Defluviitaleaceae bacterium]|nr:molybdopterin-binding protein [Defluviitaleaceae bacterium]
MKGIVKAVCTSPVKGQKQDVQKAFLKKEWGIEGDAHANTWHRQVSLLSYDKVKSFNDDGAGVSHGDFGENLVVEGIDFRALPVGTLLKCGNAVLEVTQIGKECHVRCGIFYKMGDCIMPREGVFARVLEEGHVGVDDIMEVMPAKNTEFTAIAVTLSDKGAAGQREDESGKVVVEMLANAGYKMADAILLPDDQKQIQDTLITLSDLRQINLIVTTGGTGFSKRDVTPEATLAVAGRIAPGIAEAIRNHSLSITGRAMLSRGVAVLRGDSLIVNLPGSPKAVREILEYILPHLQHGLEVLTNKTNECGGN